MGAEAVLIQVVTTASRISTDCKYGVIVTQNEGATMIEFRQGFRAMAAPTRELEKLIVSRKLAHGGNPVTRWMAANVAVAQDPAGNLKPAKDKSTERIDGIVALIMAIGRAMVAQDEPEPEYQMFVLY
jgi:phage terminase large subunit-like protein